MAGLLNKFMDFIGIEETEMDDDMYGDEYYEAKAKPKRIMSQHGQSQQTAAYGGQRRQRLQRGKPSHSSFHEDDCVSSHQL